MNTLPDLPTQAQFVSATELANGVLTVRLKPESVVEANAGAYVLRAHEPLDGESTLRALELVREAGEYHYVTIQGACVVLSGEGGEELMINARRFSGERVELNTAEFKEALAFAVRLYESEHEAGRQAAAKLHRVRELLDEQARRIALKGEGHERNSAVGVLYAQHAQFLERVRRATEA